MLVLFDLDGTLLTARGLGVPSFLEALEEIVGRSLPDEPTRFAGSLDPLIFRTLCREAGVERPHLVHDAFRRRYGERLARRIGERPDAVEALPGALDLVGALARRPGVTLGLLTGNYPETGRLKLRAAGFDPGLFGVCAFGTDAVDRRVLPRVAAFRFRERFGRRVHGHEVVVVGDTPRDVECARSFGARAVAVATGPFPPGALEDADVVLETLEGAAAALLP